MHEALARANFERDVAVLSGRVAEIGRLTVHERVFPLLDATIVHTKPLRLRMQADNWDELPPSITLLNPDGTPISLKMPGGVFHPGGHPGPNRPFICMRGSREYHTHPNHHNDGWANYRGQDGMSLVGILMQLSFAWRKAMR